MHQRAKPFAVQVIEIVQTDNGWRHKQAVRWNVYLMDYSVLHLGTIGHQLVIGILINDRANVGRRISRIADVQGVHGAAQHLKCMFCDILLQKQ